jgi:hypothetical protein
VIPLPDLHEELTQKKIQTQYSFWTTPLNPDKPWTGDATLLFSPLEQGKYALQTDFVTISETNIKNLIVEEFVPLVGIRLYNHTYTVPTWVCNDVYESKVPTSNEENEKKYREKLIEDNKLLIQENNIDADNLSTEDLNKAIWKIYYEKPYTDLVGRVIGNDVVSGIYKITNLENQMCYVGQSVNLADRWKQHLKRGIGAETPTRNKLYPAMQSTGVENFSFEVIEVCPKEELDEKEKIWQNYFNAMSHGYSMR